MKDKEKQIEEIANMLEDFRTYRLFCGCNGLAKMIYDKLLPVDSVVVTREEIEEEHNKAVKETAEKILKDLIKNCQYTFGLNGKPIIALDGDFALNTAKQFGVDIKE